MLRPRRRRRELLEAVVALAVQLDEQRMQRREVLGEASGERSVERAGGFGGDAPDLVDVAGHSAVSLGMALLVQRLGVSQ